MLLDLEDLREDYNKSQLSMADAAANPFTQFDIWFRLAQASEVKEPNAMTLATVSMEGRPKARIVLLKKASEQGFFFYTNYDSQKGKDLIANPFAALVFFWDAQHRQVRIEGRVSKISQEESKAYFQSRPKGSQIGATASPQSRIIPDRDKLKLRVAELEKIYDGQDQLPLPANWGGFSLVPDRFEFWQGRTSRLHDRIQYRLVDEKWIKERLAP